MCLCPCTDLTEVEVDFEAMEATEDRPEGPWGASRDTSTSYDGSHTVLPVRDRVFLTSQSTVSSHDPLAPEAGVPQLFVALTQGCRLDRNKSPLAVIA